MISLTERVEESAALRLVVFVEALDAADGELDDAGLDEPFDERLHRVAPRVRRIVFLVLVRLKNLLVRPLLEHFDHRDDDVRVFVREQVRDRVVRGELE